MTQSEKISEIRSGINELLQLVGQVLQHQQRLDKKVGHIFHLLTLENKELEIIMTDQEQLDAIAASEVAEIAAIGDAINQANEAIKAEEANEKAGTPINFDSIKAAVASLSSIPGNVLAIAAAPPVTVPPADGTGNSASGSSAPSGS